MMEAARTSETSVNLYKSTRRKIPGDSHLHTPRREKLNVTLTCHVTYAILYKISVKSNVWPKRRRHLLQWKEKAWNWHWIIVNSWNAYYLSLSSQLIIAHFVRFLTRIIRFLLRNQLLPVSNLGAKTGYPDRNFSWFFSVPPGQCRYRP
jgi:hypothetical protein